MPELVRSILLVVLFVLVVWAVGWIVGFNISLVGTLVGSVAAALLVQSGKTRLALPLDHSGGILRW